MCDDLSFRAYQREAILTNRDKDHPLRSLVIPLAGLAGETGSLLTEYKKWLRDGERYRPFKDQVSEEIGDILWYLANIAEREGLDLQEIAEENLAKIRDRWRPATGVGAGSLFPVDSYDTHFPEHERLLTQMRVELREELVDGAMKLKCVINGQPFGDPLTDNAHAEDGYRFHDVIHFTFAILLRWSPIVRKLMKRKRKSVPQIDEVEDGARAAVTEEAISALIFGYARDYSFFDDAESVDYTILRTVKQMAAPFEVRNRGLRDWEEAIIQGYRIWRLVNENRGGVFIGDADTHKVGYEPLPESVMPESTGEQSLAS